MDELLRLNLKTEEWVYVIEKVIGYFRGSLRIRISGFSPERFLNACMHRNIYIWNIQPVQDFYEMNISISDFRMLKPILKKTGENSKPIF